MDVGTGQRPVGECWHRMGTGVSLLLSERDQWLTGWRHRTETSSWMLAPYGDRWLAARAEYGPVDGC